MGRGPLAFALLFVLLPLLGFLVAWAAPGLAVGLVLASLMWLLLGFTVGLFLLEGPDSGTPKPR